MYTIPSIFEIKEIIVKEFPDVNIFIKEFTNSNEYFVLIDNKDVYYSKEFQNLITDIDMNYLFKNSIDNISISHVLENEQLSKTYYQIYFAPK